jgi:hypothetical protein
MLGDEDHAISVANVHPLYSKLNSIDFSFVNGGVTVQSVTPEQLNLAADCNSRFYLLAALGMRKRSEERWRAYRRRCC